MIGRQRSGLKLIELLVVCSILAILITLFVLPMAGFRRMQSSLALRMMCQNNLKQIMLANFEYESFHGHLPKGCASPGESPEMRLSWMVAILPFVEQEALHKQFNMELGYLDQPQSAVDKPMKIYQCPSELESAMSNYVSLAGIVPHAAELPEKSAGIGFMGYDRELKLIGITDGTSNTIAIMETNINPGPWARGGDSTLRTYLPATIPKLSSSHTGIIQTALGDGSVRATRITIDPAIFAALVTIAGGEEIKDWE